MRLINSLDFGKGVGRFGLENVLITMEIKPRSPAEYVENHDRLKQIAEACKTLGKRVVLTQGVWDMWHTGHIRYISNARIESDVVVIVAVDSDDLVRHRKGPDRPYDSFVERIEATGSHWAVDFVTIKDSLDDPYQILKIVEPDVFVISQTTGDEIQNDIEKFKKWAGEVKNFPPQSSTTTTAKLRRLKSGVLSEFRGRFDELFSEFEDKLGDDCSISLNRQSSESEEFEPTKKTVGMSPEQWEGLKK